MSINTLAMATLFQQQLDKQMLEGATSGWMEANAGQVKYSGGSVSLCSIADPERQHL